MEYLSPREGGLLRLAGLALFAGILNPVAPARAAPIPVVRVMVEREKQSVRIEGFDLMLVEVESAKRVVDPSGRVSLPVRCTLGGRMEVSLPKKGKIAVNGPLRVMSLGGFIRVGSSQFRDDLYVYSFNGDCVVVNHVDLEKYVAGLLNSEMSAKWSDQTLMAQAVAARTYAIHQMQENSSVRFRGLRVPFDLEGSVRDQVYEGAHQERYRALKAVQNTRGLILSYGGKPIKAFYHSTCGGKTESPERVWGMRLPYLRSVECGFCNRSPRFNWVYSPKLTELEARLRAAKLLKGKLITMKVVGRNGVGRAAKIEIEGSGGNTIASATRVRELAGAENVRSTDFAVVHSGSSVVFVGHGSGHGVGMCQWGAKVMGDLRYSYQQILKKYYPEATLARLY